MGDTAELLLQLRAAALVEQEAYKQEGATYLSPNTTICGRAATTIEETMQMLLERDKRISALECRMVELPPVREPSEFVTDVDGYVYYWPHGSTQGHYAAHHLRRIATELDDRNKEWDEQIQNDPVLAPAAGYLGEGNE